MLLAGDKEQDNPEAQGYRHTLAGQHWDQWQMNAVDGVEAAA